MTFGRLPMTANIGNSIFNTIVSNATREITFSNTNSAAQINPILLAQIKTITNNDTVGITGPQIFLSTKSTPTITGFLIPTKTIIDGPFQITPPDSNSSGSFSYTSSDISVATILGNIITIVGAGSSTITATQSATTNYISGKITTTFQVNQATSTPTITGFSIPTKTFGNDPFQITPPTSNSDGSFSYTSSDTLVATISEDIITIVGAGSSTITATQAATTNYTSGTITTTFQVIENTPSNPADISNDLELYYFLTTNAEYGGITNDLTVTSDLINTGETQKTLINMTNDFIYITQL
jgi:hypothetical protein